MAQSVASAAYDDDFFDYISIGSRRSAAAVIPLFRRWYKMESLLDVGCGRGAWLCEWHRSGVSDYLGIDGDYVDRGRLAIPGDRFQTMDLAKPFDLDRKFDLVVSLEVGEHIRPEATDTFVDNLCLHSDGILFSAAIPGQGGTSHVNEQNYEFWRDRFRARGFRLFDFLRPMIRKEAGIEPWYRYNTLLFARGDAVHRLTASARGAEINSNEPVPDYSSITWRLRNAVIRRLPPQFSERLVELKHQLVRWRYGGF